MPTIALVSCVKQKLTVPAQARNLYVSTLFREMRRYAEAWYILSTRYGLLSPDQVVSPYELTLGKMTVVERKRWAAAVAEELLRVVPQGAVVLFLARTQSHLQSAHSSLVLCP